MGGAPPFFVWLQVHLATSVSCVGCPLGIGASGQTPHRNNYSPFEKAIRMSHEHGSTTARKTRRYANTRTARQRSTQLLTATGQPTRGTGNQHEHGSTDPLHTTAPSPTHEHSPPAHPARRAPRRPPPASSCPPPRCSPGRDDPAWRRLSCSAVVRVKRVCCVSSRTVLARFWRGARF